MIICALVMQDLPNVFSISPATQAWWRDLLLNVGAGLISAAAFVLLYEQVLKTLARQKLISKKKALVNYLRFPLVEHFNMLINLYQGSLPRAADMAPEKRITSFDALFSDDYFKIVRQIDLRGPMDKLVFPVPWPEYIEQRCKSFSAALNAAVSFGASCLEPEEIELFLAVQGSFFMRSIEFLPREVAYIRLMETCAGEQITQSGLHPKTEDSFFNQFEVHVMNFKRILEWCNNTFGEPIIYPENWKDYGQVSPGCSHFPFEHDH